MEKLHVNHFWELMSEVVVIKVSCFQRAFKAGRVCINISCSGCCLS